ncbi:hypothetical protein HSB1_41310 [Halogranum salarium B-1]|uniref:Uncharacterized protein n=1 Tax=Halogranum salarium B-1 TaxID=1210908 RepID=J2ZWN4_9EURY|nr:hypothetical protein HSB1_41310 [Halogranum salarium B-1]
MQWDEPHPVVYTRDDAICDVVVDFVVRTVGPPDEDVGFVEDGLREAVLRFLECGWTLYRSASRASATAPWIPSGYRSATSGSSCS